ncbi:hypothetical protein LJC10_05730, partial [Selenomonadales bacterium OttesenSCG-928-I06]|nr:hypothetical protein [Selenomonadales bacterium OttesenSCG-928-I06]
NSWAKPQEQQENQSATKPKTHKKYSDTRRIANRSFTTKTKKMIISMQIQGGFLKSGWAVYTQYISSLILKTNAVDVCL